MQKQRESDWNHRYLSGDTPWEDSEPFERLEEVSSEFTSKAARVLEIGCGLGTNAHKLAELGYRVTAIDISQKAVDLASERYQHSNLEYRCINFLEDDFKEQFDLVFDKGCMHSFRKLQDYRRFARGVYELLRTNGIWINVSGNADNRDDLVKRKSDLFPRLSLSRIAVSTEECFEILSAKRTPYGKEVSFMAWLVVMQKRSFFYGDLGV